MQTIIYQGQRTAVQLVNYVNGDGITTSTHKQFSDDEELLRAPSSVVAAKGSRRGAVRPVPKSTRRWA